MITAARLASALGPRQPVAGNRQRLSDVISGKGGPNPRLTHHLPVWLVRESAFFVRGAASAVNCTGIRVRGRSAGRGSAEQVWGTNGMGCGCFRQLRTCRGTRSVPRWANSGRHDTFLTRGNWCNVQSRTCRGPVKIQRQRGAYGGRAFSKFNSMSPAKRLAQLCRPLAQKRPRKGVGHAQATGLHCIGHIGHGSSGARLGANSRAGGSSGHEP
jgi:hypothetical protein